MRRAPDFDGLARILSLADGSIRVGHVGDASELWAKRGIQILEPFFELRGRS